MTYLVMECHPAYAIVLDQRGRMIKVANMGYEEGQKVADVMEQQSQITPMRMRFASIAAAACLFIALLGSGAYGAFFVPYGTVRMKINPDIMLSVSYMDRVVGLKGLNGDGGKLIEQVSFKGKHAEEMALLLAERAVDMGYLSDGGIVTVSADAGSSQWRQRREADIATGLEKQFHGRITVEIRTEEDGIEEDGVEAGTPATSSVSQPVTQPAVQPTIQPSQPATQPEVQTEAQPEAQPEVQPEAQPAAGQGTAAPDLPVREEKPVPESSEKPDMTGDKDEGDHDDDIRDDDEEDRDEDDDKDDDDDDGRNERRDEKDHDKAKEHDKNRKRNKKYKEYDRNDQDQFENDHDDDD